MGDEEQVVIRVVHAISEVKAEEWDVKVVVLWDLAEIVFARSAERLLSIQ